MGSDSQIELPPLSRRYGSRPVWALRRAAFAVADEETGSLRKTSIGLDRSWRIWFNGLVMIRFNRKSNGNWWWPALMYTAGER